MRGDYITLKEDKRLRQTNGVVRLEELTWKQLDSYDREKTIFFIPINPLEEHGPHLPVGTDYLIAQQAAKEGIKQLSHDHPELTCVLCPSIPVGYTKIASSFPGTISTHVKALKTIVYDLLTSLAQFGFKYYLICSYHMDLGHLKGIYAGMHKAEKQFPIRVYEPWGPYFYNKEVEKREPKVGFDTKKEVHAGFRETSVMNYQYPYLVDPSYTRLQSIYRDLYSPKFIGKTFKEIGLNEGYVGSPARADSNYGRWYFNETVTTFKEAAVNLIQGKELPGLPKRAKKLMRAMFWL